MKNNFHDANICIGKIESILKLEIFSYWKEALIKYEIDKYKALIKYEIDKYRGK